jgi:hypothetical protein
MKALRANRLPLLLAALPLLALALNFICQLDAFSLLRPFAETLALVLFLPPFLFFDWIGAIRWNLFAGDARLFGSAAAADAVYILTASLVLFVLGKLLLQIGRLWR